MRANEQVVLLAESGEIVGTALKSEVHTESTPLHLAFSCHVFDSQGRTLITRRSLAKATWPGVWTNSFCGDPAPGETMVDAVRRRAVQELGAPVSDVSELLPLFRYRAVDASGIVENEVCPVFTAQLAGELAPIAEEVMDYAWIDPSALRIAVDAAPFAFSPWLVLQLRDCAFRGGGS